MLKTDFENQTEQILDDLGFNNSNNQGKDEESEVYVKELQQVYKNLNHDIEQTLSSYQKSMLDGIQTLALNDIKTYCEKITMPCTQK